MKLPNGVLSVLRSVGGVALVAAMSTGCASGAALAAKPTLNTQVTVVASSSQNSNEPSEADPEPTETEWTEDSMMAACGRG